MEGAGGSSCQKSASKHYYLGEDLKRGVGQNPSWDVCKPGGQLQETVWPLWLPTRVLPPSTKPCFAKGSNTYLTHSNANQFITCFKCIFLDFICFYSVYHCSNKLTIKVIDLYYIHFFVRGQTYKISSGSKKKNPHCIYIYIYIKGFWEADLWWP